MLMHKRVQEDPFSEMVKWTRMNKMSMESEGFACHETIVKLMGLTIC